MTRFKVDDGLYDHPARPPAVPVLRTCSEATARELTDRLRQSLTVAWELLVEAYQRRAWYALGYTSWDAYTDAELGEVRLRLPREQRREVVQSMTEAGMSTRAIGSALGVGQRTVVRDQRCTGESSDSPEAAPRDVAAEFAEFVQSTEFDDVVDAELVDEDPHDSLADQPPVVAPNPVEQDAPRVQGTDGKSYPAPASKEPAASRRRPLTKSFWEAAYDLGRLTERLTRLAEDDRFPQNADEVAASHRNDLVRHIDALQNVVNRLPAA